MFMVRIRCMTRMKIKEHVPITVNMMHNEMSGGSKDVNKLADYANAYIYPSTNGSQQWPGSLSYCSSTTNYFIQYTSYMMSSNNSSFPTMWTR